MRQALIIAAASTLSAAALAGQTAYISRELFLADSRVGDTLAVNFDEQAPGTDLTGQTLNGALLEAPGASPLLVILGSVGVRNPMSPSTGLNVLSPGGSSTTAEDDDLTITLAEPVSAFGLDVVFDVPDGASFVGVTFFNADGLALYANGAIPAPSGLPGYQFIGLVRDQADIAVIQFNEYDPSPFDDHVAYDSLIFTVPAACPEDLNGDGAIGFADLNIVVDNFNTTGPDLPGDVDQDGDVDFEDLNRIVSLFNTDC